MTTFARLGSLNPEETRGAMNKQDVRRIVKGKGWEKDHEGMAVWFRVLYDRDFDCGEDGIYHGKDSRDGTIESAIRYAVKP